MAASVPSNHRSSGLRDGTLPRCEAATDELCFNHDQVSESSIGAERTEPAGFPFILVTLVGVRRCGPWLVHGVARSSNVCVARGARPCSLSNMLGILHSLPRLYSSSLAARAAIWMRLFSSASRFVRRVGLTYSSAGVTTAGRGCGAIVGGRGGKSFVNHAV
jgi:hypothetical protein